MGHESACEACRTHIHVHGSGLPAHMLGLLAHMLPQLRYMVRGVAVAVAVRLYEQLFQGHLRKDAKKPARRAWLLLGTTASSGLRMLRSMHATDERMHI